MRMIGPKERKDVIWTIKIFVYAFCVFSVDGFTPACCLAFNSARAPFGVKASNRAHVVSRMRRPRPLKGLSMQLYKKDYLSQGDVPDPDRSQGGWPGTGNIGPHDVDMPALPVMTGSMFLGGKPLFPGSLQVVSGAVLSPGQVHAVQCALAFAAVDKRLKGRPIVAYFGSVIQDNKVTGNIATLAEIEEVLTDDCGKISSVSLAGVSRAVIPRVRQVRDKPLLVADKWKVYLDDIPPSSYMHTLEKLRQLADTCSEEHSKRRQLRATISAAIARLQICDELGGTCDTEVLLQLGPEVYAKAMEIMAARSALTQSGGWGGSKSTKINVAGEGRVRENGGADERSMLEPIEGIAAHYDSRVARWSDLWPEWGDEKDGELRHLRSISFAAWASLGSAASVQDLNKAMNSCSTIERLEEAIDKIQEDRRQLQRALRVLEKLESNLGTITLKRRDSN